MNSRVESEISRLDIVKLVLASLLVIAGLVAFYAFSDHSLLLRAIGMLVVLSIAGVIAAQTEKGRRVWGFVQDAQIEVRKVVWPTRQETTQTTMLVMLMVIIVALILWLLDIFLGWAIRLLLGQ